MQYIKLGHSGLDVSEEEREMLQLCADVGVQTIVYSPLARGRLARPSGESTARSEAEGAAVRLDKAHIDDAVAALSITLTNDEVVRLEAPYTPRVDGQGMSDPILLARATEATTGFRASAA